MFLPMSVSLSVRSIPQKFLKDSSKICTLQQENNALDFCGWSWYHPIWSHIWKAEILAKIWVFCMPPLQILRKKNQTLIGSSQDYLAHNWNNKMKIHIKWHWKKSSRKNVRTQKVPVAVAKHYIIGIWKVELNLALRAYLKQELVILQQVFHHSYLHICLAKIWWRLRLLHAHVKLQNSRLNKGKGWNIAPPHIATEHHLPYGIT